MSLNFKSLELRFPGSDFGLSARRLWEHTELGQINASGHAISDRPGFNDPHVFIDFVCYSGDAFSLAGLTTAEFLAHKLPRNWPMGDNIALHVTLKSRSVNAFVNDVAAHLDR
jgi:hypothetical protein